MGDRLALDSFSLLDTHETPFVLIDAQYRIVAANGAYCTGHDITPEEIVGRLCHEVSHHSSKPCFQHGEVCPHQQVFATGQACEALHVHYDPHDRVERVRLKGYPVRGSDGRLYLGELISSIGPCEDPACSGMQMAGRSPAFLKCVDKLLRLAESDAPILLYGESGVGKELAAHFVHQHSSRAAGPFVAVNCAAIPETMFESEFFGHEKGAFTGCLGRKPGFLEQANGGTLFLDEVGDIPQPMQPKLLRALESGEVRRLGGTRVSSVDVRLVSATNRDLLALADAGRFRQDLYYRVAGLDVVLPTLRERREDIPELARILLEQLSTQGRRSYRLGRDALALLMDYDFPGNVRELRNILTRAAALCSNGTIRASHIRLRSAAGRAATHPVQPPAAPQPQRLADLERRQIGECLTRHGGHRRRAADALGISERTLYRKLRRFGL
ncbi:MAG: Fis family transcriptional regulator [Rhodocyclales bacterium CG17_big_fil_post_rev_8_21_14_2_50_68_7]|nr:MAG: Fis family transcriptional regulator [Betaproteobacteria bacterium CG2_30_68_42]PIV74667.1 MAG: Fis family transcriptional regulator [Rhodocyclales bacterium CG17_big_fil_post_rev_8_21_14_2_50_68_7]PIX76337.1 MAG: Fis family transcriptional regulator [Rhodocyclales bacterium CG_4_10_14_3_um_filter_68_10]PJA57682.1 MAG: Fis family transcriptional regulator [Rhodocyclales bacterium CG_4_9_14_3_um_filter_68_10]